MKTKDDQRQEAIDGAFSTFGSSAAAYGYLFDAGYAAGKPQWIKCSERLPDSIMAEIYLVATEMGDDITDTEILTFDGDHWCEIPTSDIVRDDVLAWMLLPKSFEGSNRE
jgi:hypothetical protein